MESGQLWGEGGLVFCFQLIQEQEASETVSLKQQQLCGMVALAVFQTGARQRWCLRQKPGFPFTEGQQVALLGMENDVDAPRAWRGREEAQTVSVPIQLLPGKAFSHRSPHVPRRRAGRLGNMGGQLCGLVLSRS